MKYSIVLSVLLICSCSVVSKQTIPGNTLFQETEIAKKEIIYNLPVNSITPFEMFTFTIEADTREVNTLGIGFIAGSKIWTADHIFNDNGYNWVEKDVREIGESPIKGLDICKEDHSIGDIFFYKTKKGPILSQVMLEENEYYEVLMKHPMRVGNSGSPVLCYDHLKVVGLVSGYAAIDPKLGFFSKIPVYNEQSTKTND
jgi:hypothetical protein